MTAKMNFSLLAICGFGLALPAFAQFDAVRFASGLRAKYGPPLARETFVVRPGMEMIVDYAGNGDVCRIQLPPIAPERESNVMTSKALDDFVAELVPLTIRGKELRRLYEAMGLPAMLTVEYENVTISELLQGKRRTAVTIAFKSAECLRQPVE